MRKLLLLLALTVSAVAQNPRSLVLSWSDTDLTANPSMTFNVYRDTHGCSDPALNLTLLASTAAGITTYTDSTILNGQAYCYAVTGVFPGSPAVEGPKSNVAGGIILFSNGNQVIFLP